MTRSAWDSAPRAEPPQPRRSPWYRGAVSGDDEGSASAPGVSNVAGISGFPSVLGAPGSPRAWGLFEIGFRPWLRRQLAGIHLAGVDDAAAAIQANPSAAGAPVVFVANHTSWYDGFLLREVHRRLRPASPLRSIMLHAELSRSRTLRWIGGTSLDPDRPATLRGALRELDALRDQGVVISFFPQGRIFPATRRPLGFRPGVRLVLRRLAPVTVLPVAIHLEMGNLPRPTAWILAGTPEWIPGHRAGEGMTAVGAEALDERVGDLLDRIQGLLCAHGEGTGAHWPPS
ncbi:MAG: hypothetical protein EA350_14185 [Gemmatimonadales bacterium]|nr:MAG: hypothetical protein EA350_14185 [Gemmatimonadales bacterium]